MEDQLLENVYIEVEQEDEEFEVLKNIPIASLAFNTPASTYIILRLPEDVSLLATSFTNTLKFVVKDVDAGPNDPGLTDEYPLEELSISVADHIQRVLKANFAAAWEEFDDSEGEAEETYFLTKFPTIKGRSTISRQLNLKKIQAPRP